MEEDKNNLREPGDMAVSDGAGMVVDDAGRRVSGAGRRVSGAGGVDDMNDRLERQRAVMPLEEQIRTLREMSRKMNMESDEERARRERRERSRRLVSAVGDGVRALSNMWFTHRYAPDAYDHNKTSMLAAEDARIERARGERERDRDRWLNYSLRIGDMEGQKARTLRELEGLQQRRRLARQKAEADAQRLAMERALQPFKQRELIGKANKAEADALSAKAEADNKPKALELQNSLTTARIGQANAAAAANNRSNVSEFSAWDENGREHKFRTKQAAEEFAKQHGTWQEVNVSETTSTETRRTPESKPQQRSTTKTKKSGHPARPAPEDNTPPSRRNNDNNTPPSRR